MPFELDSTLWAASTDSKSTKASLKGTNVALSHGKLDDVNEHVEKKIQNKQMTQEKK